MGKEIDKANNLLRIPDILSALASEMCDGYCKFREQYEMDGKSQDDLIEEVCNDCPIVRWLG